MSKNYKKLIYIYALDVDFFNYKTYKFSCKNTIYSKF